MMNGRGARDGGSAGLHKDLFHLTWKEEISARLHDYGRVFFSFHLFLFFFSRIETYFKVLHSCP